MNHRAPCPVCNRGPRDRALSVMSNERGTVSYCHRCGYSNAERHNRNVVQINDRRTSCTIENDTPLDWSSKAEAIWRRTQSLRGSLGGVYLKSRGCLLPPGDSHLRYLPSTDKHPPSLCAAISDAVTGRPISLHFTRLADDGKTKRGTDFDKILLAGHRKKGGIIRLWPDDAVTDGLAIAEGIESALSAAYLFTPVWACIDAGNLANLFVLDGIESLTIFADHDPAGIAAARSCGKRWRDASKDVVIKTPRITGHDLNDEVAA